MVLEWDHIEMNFRSYDNITGKCGWHRAGPSLQGGLKFPREGVMWLVLGNTSLPTFISNFPHNDQSELGVNRSKYSMCLCLSLKIILQRERVMEEGDCLTGWHFPELAESHIPLIGAVVTVT